MLTWRIFGQKRREVEVGREEKIKEQNCKG
jgi:hypothetical protein